MRPAPFLLAALLLVPGMAAAQDTTGTLTVHGPGSGEARSMPLDSMALWLPTVGDPDQGPGDLERSRTVTVTGPVEAPDPDLLAWASSASSKRRVTLEMIDDPEGRTRSTYEFEGARAVTLSISYGGGSGQQSLMIQADHLKINGQAIY